ncbi:MAG TPA: acyltransferase [Polyangia bacterium]|jgi:acetyltransferase-like isoleucine patch superfamily enzyme
MDEKERDSGKEQRNQDRHKRRLSYMPWLYHSQRARSLPHLDWMAQWQREVQADLQEQEAVTIGADSFIAPDAQIFAEPNRPVIIGARCSVAATAYLHGPITLGDDVSINPGAHLEGGRGGIVIGSKVRIAAGARLYAFEHGLAPGSPIVDQPTTSVGIRVGDDVWLGANAGITDGVTIGSHVVVAMGAVVVRDVPEWAIVGGVPARVLGDRRGWSTRA